jgi:hypothetical protein
VIKERPRPMDATKDGPGVTPLKSA